MLHWSDGLEWVFSVNSIYFLGKKCQAHALFCCPQYFSVNHTLFFQIIHSFIHCLLLIWDHGCHGSNCSMVGNPGIMVWRCSRSCEIWICTGFSTQSNFHCKPLTWSLQLASWSDYINFLFLMQTRSSCTLSSLWMKEFCTLFLKLSADTLWKKLVLTN